MSGLPSLSRAAWLKAPSLQRLFSVIAEAGGEARVAGGAVRNALLHLRQVGLVVRTKTRDEAGYSLPLYALTRAGIEAALAATKHNDLSTERNST